MQMNNDSAFISIVKSNYELLLKQLWIDMHEANA
jgi:hypothetical protein